MAADSDVNSRLMRAKFSVMVWIDLLPEDAKLEASMAMNHLIQVAEREIDEAYRDGMSHRSMTAVAQRMKKEQAVALPNGECK